MLLRINHKRNGAVPYSSPVDGRFLYAPMSLAVFYGRVFVCAACVKVLKNAALSIWIDQWVVVD